MGIIITPKAEIDAYFDSDRMSQSLLKKLLGGMEKFKTAREESDEKALYYEEKGNFIIGSAVDTILTGEEGQFEEEYYKSELENKPSDVEMSITHMVFDEVTDAYDREFWEDKPLTEFPGFVSRAIEEHNWQPRWKPETKLSKICEVCADYFEDLKKAYGKQILDQQQKTTIDNIVMSLKTHPRTIHLFDREVQARNGGMDFYYQLPIYFTYKGVDCKALLDLVVVIKDADGKTEQILVYDLKTMDGDTLWFPSSIKRWRYDIQAAWYTLALYCWLQNQDKVNVVKVHPFQFIVESTNIQGKPLIFEMDSSLLDIGREGKPELIYQEGRYTNMISREVLGFEQLIDLYLWHEEHGWEEDKVIAQANGEPLVVDYNGFVKQ